MAASLLALTLVACTSEAADTEAQAMPEPATPAMVAPDQRASSSPYMAQPALLVFSETTGWRHEGGIAGANVALNKIAQDAGLGIFTTEDSSVFNAESLSRFHTVVFNNMTGDSLTAEEKAAFEQWMSDGGTTLLIHGAMDSSHTDWDYYQTELLGPVFISHPMAPQIQEARVVNLAPEHPVMTGFSSDFMHPDEWYTFDAVPDERFDILAGLDESSYDPRNTVYEPEDLRMGPEPEDHPIIWARCLPNGGRVVASALGHTVDSYSSEPHRQLLVNAIDWLQQSGQGDEGCRAAE